MPEEYSFGLIGYPVEHSLSPRIHNAALQELDLAGEYRLYRVEQPGGLQEILGDMRSGKVHGLNVTIPYKNEILPLLGELTPTAQAMGAVNTISNQRGSLIGDNTDAKGFLADLERLAWFEVGGHDRNALVLGAGGSAHAVVYALAREGWGVYVAARRIEQATALVEIIQVSVGILNHDEEVVMSAIALDKDSLSTLDPQPDLIINTTPVGMFPKVDASPWPRGLDLPPLAALYDLVYNPAETMLMQDARNWGIKVANGIGMLVEQAALSLEIWTGLTAPRKVMRHAVMEYSTGVE